VKDVKAEAKDENVKAPSLGEKGATYNLKRNMSMSAMPENKENVKGNLPSVHPKPHTLRSLHPRLYIPPPEPQT